MSVEFASNEEDLFNFYWRIKNFSYSTESISSPVFKYHGILCSLVIHPETVQCQLIILTHDKEIPQMEYLLSFLPCDESNSLIAHSRCLQLSKEVLFRTRRRSFLPDDTLTVHLQLPTFSETGRLLVQSQVGVIRKCFVWTMKNFIEDQQRKKDFKIINRNNARFGIVSMSLKSIDGINSDQLFYIEISLYEGEKCYCFLDVSVLNSDGKAVNSVNGEFRFKTENDEEQKWNFPPVIKKSKLLACKDRLLPGGTLSLKCNIAISMGTVTEETSVLSYFGDVSSLEKESEDISNCFKERSRSDSATDLQSDLEKIWDNETFSDAKLVVCSHEIGVHKSILGARSPVFESMFMEGIGENINTFVIEDIPEETLFSLLLYMYTDTIHDADWKFMKNLYLAAKKYQVQSLERKCSSFLKSKFEIANICELLSLADFHGDTDLETAALDFISKHDSEVFASRKWKDMERYNCSLAIRTLRHICLQK